MKFSYEWIRELVPDLTTEPTELQRLITIKTAECEGIEPAGTDSIIEIDNKSLTHRPDLWGHIGMAREVAAITGNILRDPVKPALLPQAAPVLQVEIDDRSLCSRYSALLFDNVQIGPSSAALQARLGSVGLNPINNVVDITNYILAEIPQPMHAFDAGKLAGSTIYVRNAKPGEQLAALNGETYELVASDLVIADASGPIALAGVIGGAESAVSESTTRIVLESANFQASSIRLTSTRHKLRTDASIRFEKSLDPENTVRGLARAIELLQGVCPGIRAVGGVTDNRGAVSYPQTIRLPLSFVIRKLGKDLSEEYVSHILNALGFGINQSEPGVLAVTVPTWRATKDISVKDDLVEEIGRMVGYGEIVPTPPRVASVAPPANPMRTYLRGVRQQIAAQGFTEVYNYSFVTSGDVQRFFFDIQSHIGVRNPIAAELTHLRRSLLPGLFKNVVTNVRNFSQFRLFEIGNEIKADEGSELPTEVTHLAAVLYDAGADQESFFEMKRAVECVFPSAWLKPAEALAYEHPARAAEIHWNDRSIGRLFELHPSILATEGIEGRAVLFDVNLQLAQELSSERQIKYTPLRKYPTSGFDLSVVADNKLPVRQIQQQLSEFAGEKLVTIDFVRQYGGPPLLEGEKSVSYHLEIGAPDHTLTSEEATEIRERIVGGMRAAGFEIRGLD